GKKNFLWTEAALRALNMPLQALFWVIGVTVVIQILSLLKQNSLVHNSFPPVRNVAVILIAMWFFLRMISRSMQVIHTTSQRSNKTLDATASDAVGKLVQACIVVIAILMIMAALDFSISSLIAFG